MTTVHARVTILVSSSLLCLGAFAGTAMAVPMPDDSGVPVPSAAPAAQVAAPSVTGVPAHVDARTHSTQPVYDYADAIRESVYVYTHLDTDSDGQTDKIAVDIVRPRET